MQADIALFPGLSHLQLLQYTEGGGTPWNKDDQGVVVSRSQILYRYTNLWNEISCFQRHVTGEVQINLYVYDKEC